MTTVAGLSKQAGVEVKQGGRAGIHLEDHVTAAPPVAAVWAAQRLELLTVNRGAAVSRGRGGGGGGGAGTGSGKVGELPPL